MMIAAIDRYVREKCGYSVLKDKDFEVSRKVLNGKATDLHGKETKEVRSTDRRRRGNSLANSFGKRKSYQFFFSSSVNTLLGEVTKNIIKSELNILRS